MNTDNILRFTTQLYDLIEIKKYSLLQSLEIISEVNETKNNIKIKLGAKEILQSMLNGNTFSVALGECKNLKFPEPYIRFIGFSELSGNLAPVILFLKEKYEEKQKLMQTVITSLLYPATVSFLAIIFCLLFFLNYKKLFPDLLNNGFDLNKRNFFLSIFAYALLSFFVIKKMILNFSENRILEAFLSVSHLIKSGMNLSFAFTCSAVVLGENTREGKMLINARNKLLLGMDLKTAFGIDEKNHMKIEGLETAIYYGQKGGRKEEVFEKVAQSIKEKEEHKRKLWLSFIEPVFVGITGLFLILLVMSVILPVITNAGIIF